jgi:DNA primase
MNRDEMHFTDPVYQKIFSIVQEYVDRGEPLDDSVFLRSSDPELSRVAATLMAPLPELSAIWTKEGSIPPNEEDKLPELVPKTLLALKNQIVLDAIKEAQRKLRQAQENGNTEEISFYQLRISELNNFKKSFAKELGERIVIR